MLSRLRALAVVAVAAIVSPQTQIRAAALASSAPGAPPAVLTIEGLGKGVAPLDGPWQFHLGDDPTWARPGIDDATGHNGWEQLTADAPWGTQGHPGYTGYAWYRRQLNVSPAPGASPDVTLLIPAIDDVYELFWNGAPVGQLGSFPPRLDSQFGYTAHRSMGSAQPATECLRCEYSNFRRCPSMTGAQAASKDCLWPAARRPSGHKKMPSISDGCVGGSSSSALRRSTDWHPFSASLPGCGTASSGCCSGWRPITFMPVLELVLSGLRLPVSGIWLTFAIQTAIAVRELCQWFLLIYLLQLDGHTKLMRAVRIAACVGVLVGALDGALAFAFHFNWPAVPIQIADAILTADHPSAGIGPDSAGDLRHPPASTARFSALAGRDRRLVERHLVLLREHCRPGDSVHPLDTWTKDEGTRYSPCSGIASASRFC